MTIDEVKRSAQQQVNKALKDHTRFVTFFRFKVTRDLIYAARKELHTLKGLLGKLCVLCSSGLGVLVLLCSSCFVSLFSL